MKKKVLMLSLTATMLLITNAWAEDTYENCYGADNCQSKTSQYGIAYYTIDNGTMTIYGPKEEGSLATIHSTIWNPSTRGANLPSSVTKLNFSGNVEIWSWAFQNATGLTSVDFTGVQELGSNAFHGATGLTSVDFSKSNVTVIGDSTFQGATGLTNADLTGVQRINSQAFYNATNLNNIVLGDTLTSVGYNAFGMVPSSAKIYCQEGSGHGGKTCAQLASAGEFRGTVQLFEKGDDGVYVVLDGQGNPSAYYSSTTAMMVGGVEDGCTSQVSCASKIQLANSGGTSSSLGGGSSSGSGLFTGERGKRIYTVEQANAVAGKKNKVMIRYR